MNERFEKKPKEQRMCSCGRGWLEPKCDCNQEDTNYWYYPTCCSVCSQESYQKNKKTDRLDELLAQSGIGIKYRNCTLSKVEPIHIEDMKDSVYFYGETGVGKTYTIVAQFKDDAAKGKDSAFTNVTKLLTRIKASFKPNPEEYESDIIEYYSNVRTLYLDDMCAEKVTEFVAATLCAIIDTRYQNELKTIITSNLPIRDLASYMGERIASRIVGMCDVVEMRGTDRRLSERPTRPNKIQ